MDPRVRPPLPLWLPALCLAAVLASLIGPGSNPSAADDAISIIDAWMPAPPPGARTAAVYFNVRNDGPTDRIIGADSDLAGKAELHTHLQSDGMMRMQRLDSIDLGEGETLEFRPHGLHIMLIDIDRSPAEGEHVEVILRFQSAGEVTFDALVRDMRG